jgi:hypothetical protein
MTRADRRGTQVDVGVRRYVGPRGASPSRVLTNGGVDRWKVSLGNYFGRGD